MCDKLISTKGRFTPHVKVRIHIQERWALPSPIYHHLLSHDWCCIPGSCDEIILSHKINEPPEERGISWALLTMFLLQWERFCSSRDYSVVCSISPKPVTAMQVCWYKLIIAFQKLHKIHLLLEEEVKQQKVVFTLHFIIFSSMCAPIVHVCW